MKHLKSPLSPNPMCDRKKEFLAALADAVCEWHAEIAEMSGAMTGQHFGEETVDAMHVELEAELERKGYGHLL